MDKCYESQPNDRLFPYTKHFLNHEMLRGCKKSGVKKIRVHDLRHSHASLLIEMGCQPLLIADRLGHAKNTDNLKLLTVICIQTNKPKSHNSLKILSTEQQSQIVAKWQM